ncbi:hypothetical protein IJI31_07020 [bacterium]|nr:hypothetical protein [bacterium]
MSKFLKFLISLMIVTAFLGVNSAYAQKPYVLEAGVSIDKVPKTLYGSWKVEAGIIETSNYHTFKPISTCLWTLSRVGNEITLSNPFSNVDSTVSLNTTEGNLIAFTRVSRYDNKRLTDIVTLRMNGETFTGINDLILETYSVIDGHLLKKETAKYKISGYKLSGEDIRDWK